LFRPSFHSLPKVKILRRDLAPILKFDYFLGLGDFHDPDNVHRKKQFICDHGEKLPYPDENNPKTPKDQEQRDAPSYGIPYGEPVMPYLQRFRYHIIDNIAH
jgi:hypothetical protein